MTVYNPQVIHNRTNRPTVADQPCCWGVGLGLVLLPHVNQQRSLMGAPYPYDPSCVLGLLRSGRAEMFTRGPRVSYLRELTSLIMHGARGKPIQGGLPELGQLWRGKKEDRFYVCSTVMMSEWYGFWRKSRPHQKTQKRGETLLTVPTCTGPAAHPVSRWHTTAHDLHCSGRTSCVGRGTGSRAL